VEDGKTFRENAAKKASAYARFSGLHALADDSGLCCEALEGAPGVRSARWSEVDGAPASPGPERSREARDEANNDKLLASLAGVPEASRGARYVAALALAGPDGVILAEVEGACAGRIGHVRRGTHGFGYDPLFVVDGAGRMMAELDPAQKDAVSHRGQAFRAVRPVLERLAFDKTLQGG
jgi:XTP/dITP diphosphohydrolase